MFIGNKIGIGGWKTGRGRKVAIGVLEPIRNMG